jgi:hypothetical protein
MICPKCGFEQPDSPECIRCGVIISRYKGPFLGAAALRPPVSPRAPSSAAGNEPAGVGSPPPAPPMEPAMAMAADGGTMYGGPPPGAAVPVPTFGVAAGPAFHGTFEVGKILGESFSIYFRNFIPFVLLTAIALSPLFLLQVYATATPDAGAKSLMEALSALVLAAATLVCPYIVTAAITYGVFQQMRGGDTSIGECLARGLTLFLPILFLAIVQGIAIFVGLILCVVPGILMALRWAVSIPAAVEERQGVSGAMSRSTYLTEGFRGEIFGILFVIGILNLGSQLVLALVAAKDLSLFQVLSGVATVFNTGLSATATAVMYYRLRSVKESIDVDQIASVFA